jgi:hypothetical protein
MAKVTQKIGDFKVYVRCYDDKCGWIDQFVENIFSKKVCPKCGGSLRCVIGRWISKYTKVSFFRGESLISAQFEEHGPWLG